MLQLINKQSIFNFANVKFIHTSFQNSSKLQEWRRINRLPDNPNTEGPLTNMPDFTYMDGKPTPLGKRHQKRILFQRELAQKIVTGSFEIDHAIDRHKKAQEEEMNSKKEILENKLKPKGHLLLNSKK